MKKNKKILVSVACIALVILAIGVMKKFNVKTVEVTLDTHKQSIPATAFVIQSEDVVSFKGGNNIQTYVNEGAKVSMNTVIGYSRIGNTNSQATGELDIIDWKIENEQYQDTNILNGDLEKINKELKNIDKKIKRANKKNKANKVRNLKAKRDMLSNKKQMILGAFRFAFTDKEKLMEIKQQLHTDDVISEGNITPKALSISYPGYVFFQRDGFENILHRELLGNINEQYFNDILENTDEDVKEHKQYNNEQVIKIVDDSNMYLVAKIPLNAFEETEEQLIGLRKEVDVKWKSSEEGNLYSFLANRKDILQQFPRVKIKSQDQVLEGYLLDINKDGVEKEKIVTIKLDFNNHNLIGQRKLSIELHDIEYRGYLLPKGSVITQDGEKGILKLINKDKQFVPIKIKKELEDSVILDPKENKEMKPQDLILQNP